MIEPDAMLRAQAALSQDIRNDYFAKFPREYLIREHYLRGIQHPDDEKVPLNLWELTPDT
jgi:hypothetical protein